MVGLRPCPANRSQGPVIRIPFNNDYIRLDSSSILQQDNKSNTVDVTAELTRLVYLTE